MGDCVGDPCTDISGFRISSLKAGLAAKVVHGKPWRERMRRKQKTSPALRRAFGAQVRFFRVNRGLTQVALAAACRLDPNYLGGIERGERNPSLENIAKIARSLDVSVAQLVATMEQ
jgi:ribosome-binding protein aMBF1 (putative translation factor)